MVTDVGVERVVLMDNGSLRPEAVFALRRLAGGLSERLGVRVEGVSLLHSSKIDAELLGGEAAEVMVPYLKRVKSEGVRRVVVLPLFFGPSAALTDYLPGRLEELGDVLPEVVIGDVMVMGDELDVDLAELMAGEVRRVVAENGLVDPCVVMVDHGTPSREVNEVRARMAGLLGEVLGGEVIACSMERREGTEYDYNEPLLGTVLGGRVGDVVVSLMFAVPGRHAGKGGDVAEICDNTGDEELKVFRTGVLSECEVGLVEFLVKRAGILRNE